MTDPRLQTLRDYLGMASGGTKTDAELWEFADEALADLDGLALEPGDPQPIVFDPPLTEAESDAYWDAIKPGEWEDDR